MEAPVNVKDVINPKRRLIETLKAETSEAPTITAKPIIMQFNGLISLRNPLGFPIFLNLVSFKIHTYMKHEVRAIEDRLLLESFRFISEMG